jgi:ArsR family transcriptional regulator
MAETTFELRFDIDKLEGAAYLLKAVVHPTRLAVIDLLDQHKEMNVTEFVNALDTTHALMSHHLTDMKSKNILQTRREEQRIFYSIKEKAVLGLLTCIQNCKQH